MKQTGKQKSNSGVTLLEVMLVIALLAVAAGLAGISISLIYSRDAQKAAKLIDSAMEETRMKNLAYEGSFALEIDVNNHSYQIIHTIVGTGTEVVAEKNLPSRTTLDFISEGTDDISGYTKLCIEFDKANGKVSRISEDGLTAAAVDIVKARTVNPEGKEATVVLITGTGKHYVEYGS